MSLQGLHALGLDAGGETPMATARASSRQGLRADVLDLEDTVPMTADGHDTSTAGLPYTAEESELARLFRDELGTPAGVDVQGVLPQMGDLILAHEVAERVLELRELDEQVVLGIDSLG